ncbi:hypothetical protein Peur_044009 [Populus x canadensis]|jgi:hypothetical protein
MNNSIKTNTNNAHSVLDKNGRHLSVDFDALRPGHNPVTLGDNPRVTIPNQSVLLIGSCNGLFTVAYASGAVFVCNPCLKEYTEITSFFLSLAFLIILVCLSRIKIGLLEEHMVWL